MDPKKLTTLLQHNKDTSPTIEGVDSDMEQHDHYERFHDPHDPEEEEYELDESPQASQFPQTQSTQAQSTQAQSTQVQSTQAPSTQQAPPAQPQPTPHQDAHAASNDLTRLNDDISNLPSDTDFYDILRSFDATFAPKEEGNKNVKNDKHDGVFPPDSQSQSQSHMPGTRAPPTSRPSSSSLPVGEIAAQVSLEHPILPNLQQQQQFLAHGLGRYAAASHAAMEAKHKELTKGRKRRSPEPESESEEDTDDDFDPLGEVCPPQSCSDARSPRSISRRRSWLRGRKWRPRPPSVSKVSS